MRKNEHKRVRVKARCHHYEISKVITSVNID